MWFFIHRKFLMMKRRCSWCLQSSAGIFGWHSVDANEKYLNILQKKLKFFHRKTHKATEDDVKTMLEGKVPSTSTAKCTTTCVMQQFKVVRWIFNKKSRGKTDLVQLSFPIGQEKWSNQVSRGRLWDMFKISWSKWCRQRENGHWKRSLWKMQSSWYHWWVSLKKNSFFLYEFSLILLSYFQLWIQRYGCHLHGNRG